MDVHVRVDLQGDVPVVVKSASGGAVERLRHERDRLDRSRHPGVVALAAGGAAPRTQEPDEPQDAASSDEYELRTLYAGEPVSRWAGSLSAVAGLGAAVASTLADLHDVGIVHGRLDASHILVGDDGRPRLCGLSHPGGASPADDVAALGSVLDELVARARPDRRSRLRRPRGAGSRSLRQVVERATDPVATRRPSARNLADAILAAVPLAQLPTGHPRARASAAREVAAPGQGSSQPDTLDRIWAFGDQRSDDERWAAAFGGAPPDRPAGGVAHPVPDLPMAVVRTPDWSALPPDDPDHRDDRGRTDAPAGVPFSPWHGPDAGLDDDRDGSAPDLDVDRWRPGDDHPGDRSRPSDDRAGDRADPLAGRGHLATDDPAGTWPPAPPHDPHTHPAGDDLTGTWQPPHLATDDHTGGRKTSGPGPDSRAWPSPRDEDLTRDHHAPAARVAAARERRADDGQRARGAPRSRQLLVVAAGSALAGVGLAAGVMLTGSGGGADTPRPDPEAAMSGEGCAPAVPPAADVDGDGCPEALVVEGTTVDAGVAQWSLGEPGDLVALGDWDCDGSASAALLRPGTGDVFVFSAWAPADEPVTVASTQRVDGAVGLRAEAADDGCDRLLVDLATGGTTPIGVSR